MIRGGATHIAVATDHVIESFRNGLWPGYKTSAGIEPELLAQFPLLEEVLSAAGIVVWPMVEFEADDALATAAIAAAGDARVERVIICTPPDRARPAQAATHNNAGTIRTCRQPDRRPKASPTQALALRF
jgi:hypothetical protein